MANKVIKSINLLPEFLRTDKNSKFLSSTIDQLIQPPQLERIDGYIGSKLTPTYDARTDFYISDTSSLRTAYQLDPALVVKDSLGTVNDVIAFDDLVNEISIQGGDVSDLSKLFNAKFYSYDPHIDWDKLVNYQEYYWLVNGPETIVMDDVNISDIIGHAAYTYSSSNYSSDIVFANGMKIRFGGSTLPESYLDREFFVEGVGTAIKLIDSATLSNVSNTSMIYNDHFDAASYDSYPFDNFKTLPIKSDYVTINRASQDANPWSQYNRWVHSDVIRTSAVANNHEPAFLADLRARRPIIEFKADLKLFNFGSTGIENIDVIDNTTLDAFSIVEGSAGYYVDGVLLDQGNRVVFNADTSSAVRGKIYQVNYITINNVIRLALVEVADQPAANTSVSVKLGKEYTGTNWWFNGDTWQYAQQRTKLNQAPLFDLFDDQGYSYGDKTVYSSQFAGNKIFGYDVGTGAADAVLGFPLKYQNSVGVGSYLFKNYFTTDTIVLSINNKESVVSTGIAYCKFADGTFANCWAAASEYSLRKVDGYYEPPLSLTNNPLNGPIASFTLSELSDHVTSGTRLVANATPISFANFFLGKQEHSAVDAITTVADQYNQFKMAFLKKIAEITNQRDPVAALDIALAELNANRDILSPYYQSDMIAYGTDKIVRTWTVTDLRNTAYPLTTEFDPTQLSHRSVLVYLNGTQLTLGKDYEFDVADAMVHILATLNRGDTIIINDYHSTVGSFIPPTPSKLGLYPAYEPSIYLDDTYATPTTVIQSHDGSITLAYNDYRDDVILEFEKRVYNNIKSQYNSKLIDVNSKFSGTPEQCQIAAAYAAINADDNAILQRDFLKWAGFYGIDYTLNDTSNDDNPRTWNYQRSVCSALGVTASGSMRAIFEQLYGTDRPHTHPWEMLGITVKPTWWESTYGPAPYTSGNDILWDDIAQGMNRGTKEVNWLYVRPKLNEILPVDESGNLVDILSIVSNCTDSSRSQAWKFGDHSPAETAWRRSSYWPFAVQRLLALSVPAAYSALMYDPSRVTTNSAGQWVYDADHAFLNPKNVKIFGADATLTDGYSVYISEVGRQRTSNYIQELTQDLTYMDFNLFHKVGGFVSKDKLQIVIDAIDPTSTSPGALLPPEDYDLILNTSNPIKSAAISGIIVQKDNGKFVIKGYDRVNPYFTVFEPMRNATTATLTVGGVSQSYVTWGSSGTGGATGLTSADTTTASSASTGKFYHQGQIVAYDGRFYRVKTAHQSGPTFDSAYFQSLPSLPTTGGATVQTAGRFGKVEKQIPYGTEFTQLQEVYDLIVGYGTWLETQGFIFDEYNTDVSSNINWNFTAKEFLYWTTQNWAPNSIITLSPFAGQLKYRLANSVVDNIFDSFYEYSILQANGTSMPQQNLNVDRQDGVCTITTANSTDGIYFAILHSVQKEHAMVFNNTTRFNDTVYDIETGYRQRRMKLVGFRTANWDGDYFSPGFVYDTAQISDWSQYTEYQLSDIVRFAGNYYSANARVLASAKFDFTQWSALGKKPVAGLLPNFDYKINQFEDFYSLDIDNFDSAQQQMAQHLIGYTPRVYLNNIFTNPIAQYKFYQGFIREKGTKNSISKLAKASLSNLQGELTFSEEWAFRVGQYGSFSTYQELEVPLFEGTFVDNPQIVKFVDTTPTVTSNDLIYYSTASNRIITPENYSSSSTFVTTADEFALTTAGYVRLDDVTTSTYNTASLVSLANSNINEGDVIWLGAKKNGDWDVLRYVNLSQKVIGVELTNPSVSITFTTDFDHNLSEGDIVSVTQFDSDVNGVYTVSFIPSLDKFTVASTLTYIVDAVPVDPAQLFKFESARFETYDNLPSNQAILAAPIGTKFWVNNDGNDKWIVYEKTKNYASTSAYCSLSVESQQLGQSISARYGADICVVGAPGNYDTNTDTYGGVFVYNTADNRIKFKYTLNHNENYQTLGTENKFGYAVVYDDHKFGETGYGLIFAGSPAASNITGLTTSYSQAGLVKISSIDSSINNEGSEVLILLSPRPSDNEQFGSSIFVERNTDSKLVLVGAPQTLTTGLGHVYAYTVTVSPTISSTVGDTVVFNSTTTTLTAGSEWGHTICGSDDAGTIAISAPGYSYNRGIVQIFFGTTPAEIIESPFGNKGRFGETMAMSPDGGYLFIGAPGARGNNQSRGMLTIYKRTDAGFVLLETLTNPAVGSEMKFGSAVSINESADILVVTALGTNNRMPTTFDKTITDGLAQDVFDTDTTNFYGTVENSGTAYVYSRKNTRFVLAEELTPVSSKPGTNYGTSVAIEGDSIYVGSPAKNNLEIASGFHKFTTTATSIPTVLRYQDDVTLVDTVQKIMLIDSVDEEVVEYLDIIDPLKGKIASVADQELKYKSTFDPAVYTIGTTATVNDATTNWLDDHVGELWWDLSTVKYQWYEQGDLSFRKNNWGRLFPGSSIDVYEWIGSEYLPSEWAQIADTAAGLTEGISGQPKFVDDTVVSVRQIYNSSTGSFSNRYYYWVKNKVTVPNVKNRRIGCYQVASIIADPTAFGLRYAAIIAKNAITLANIGPLLVADRLHINIATDDIENKIPKHTEWLLLQEGVATSVPNTLLEKKLIDSLIGHDSLGNAVPSSTLTSRTRYGIGIRPQQTFFKDRLAALRNLVEFTNSVLIDHQITSNYDFANLNKYETIPSEFSHEYDLVVEDVESLATIDTRQLIAPQLRCTVQNGKIRSIIIDNPGFGYIIAPTVSIVGATETTAKITTEIDSLGRIISATIVDAGQGFVSAPALDGRPFTVIVLSDSQSNNKWAKYIYDIPAAAWARTHTQTYDTRMYWKYQDWSSTTYNKFVDYAATVTDIDELGKLTLTQGQYVKVKNGGDNRYIILEKTAPNTVGSFSPKFNIVYSENGTIQILDSIWNYAASDYGFDENRSFDQTLYDQTPDLELQYILTALKKDLFVNELKINWNLFFFKAVKYSLSEQKLLDWAFKTSFINVKNLAGALDQRPVYKLQNSEYFEDYVKEVKPYHTTIRTFTTNYTGLENGAVATTDFDMPADSNYTNVRKNKIGMKFDRISRGNQIGTRSVTDKFICNGSENEFVLTWLAEADTFKINVSIDSASVLRSDYTVEYYSEIYNGYTKKYSKVVFLNFTPAENQLLIVDYLKSGSLLNAAERILDNYRPTSGMPGIDLGQLMTGIEYPGTVLETLPLSFSTAWDVGHSAFEKTSWADNISYYTEITVASTATAGTSTLVLSTTTGLVVGQYVNITGSVDNMFSTSTDVYIKSITSATNTVKFSSTLSNTVSAGTTVEFWNYDANNNVLDTAIDGGAFNVTGIDPTEINIDGDGLLSLASSYAPEELLPGQIAESVGINVYTKNPQGAPIIFAGNVDVRAGVASTSILSIVPPSANNIVVEFGGRMLNYSTSTNFTDPSQFAIDWATNSLIVPPQSISGKLGYTIISIGGGRLETEAGVVDRAIVTVSNTATAQVQSLSAYTSIKSAYVTVNGQSISAVTTATDYGYMLSYSSNVNHRAAVNVYNLPAGTNTIQAWFFNDEYKYFNTVNEETITVIDPAHHSYALTNPIRGFEPVVAQSIVEVRNAQGVKTRLLPPYISYYDIANNATTVFAIDSSRTHPAYTFDLSNVRIYINGNLIRAGFDYTIDKISSTVAIDPSALKARSVIAIVGLPKDANGNGDGYDYDIIGSELIISNPVDIINNNAGLCNVITFADNDGMLMRTERFDGNPTRRYKISRPVINDNYVWVQVNGVPLTSKLDYEILDDQVTVQISDQYHHTASDDLVITSISSEKLSSTIVGFRIFNDMFNRTHFKRMSKQHTTYLTQPLLITDSVIHVANAKSLTPPLVAKKIPGVIIIDGERIEFFKVTGNTLSQLRRSTLGTAPSLRSEVNTKVIDQSPTQTIPFNENIYKQVHLTSAGTNTYVISTSSFILNVDTARQLNSDGITLSTIAKTAPVDENVSNTLTTSVAIPAADQVAVYYGGRLLNKVGTYYQDITISYDNSAANISSDHLASTGDLPNTRIVGTAYVITGINQVWVYTGSLDASAVNGYVYTGLNYLPPEFTIDTATQALTLNIAHGVGESVKLAIVKKEFSAADVWNTVLGSNETQTIMDSTTLPARFLQLSPAELPDRYYYGDNK